jgi:ribose 5-phosphate isomerase A
MSSTASQLLRSLAARLREGRLRAIVGVPTSEATAVLVRQLGIPWVTLDERPPDRPMLDVKLILGVFAKSF